MADKYQDNPRNKGVVGIKNYAGDFKEGVGDALQNGNTIIGLGLFATMCGGLVGGIGFVIDGTTEVGVDFSAAADTSITQGLELQNGYAAVSNTGGRDGYVLLRDGEDYELYSFSRTEESGAFTLEYEPQNDDAWIVMRSLQHHYDTMIQAAENSRAALPDNPYGMFVFDSISKPYELEGQITRLAEGISELDVVNIADHLSAQREAWENAASAVYQDASYGFDDGEFDTESTSLEAESLRNYGMTKVMFSIAAAGVATIGFGSVVGGFSHAGRRRRERRSEYNL